MNAKPTPSADQERHLPAGLRLGRDSAALGAWLGAFAVGKDVRGVFVEREARPEDVFLAGAAREAA